MVNGDRGVQGYEIASAFVGRFRCSLQCFIRGRKGLFSGWNRFENRRLVALYDWHTNAPKWQNM